MKKSLLIVTIVVLALGALAVGTVFAQGPRPPQTPTEPTTGYGMMGGGRGGYGTMGLMHDYVEEVLADKLGLTETQVEDAFAAGTNMYQIALDNGIAEADVPTFLSDVHAAAFEKAVADGVMTQTQADWMAQRMSQNGYGYGDADGTCPMGGVAPADGTGTQYGRGMMGGGRWQQQTNP